MIFSYRPEGEHLAAIVSIVKRDKRLMTSTDGFAIFDSAFKERLQVIGVAPNQLKVLAADLFTFELMALEPVECASANWSQAVECHGCGRRSPGFRGGVGEVVMVLKAVPPAPVVRSSELFGKAYLRSPSVYVAEDAYAGFGLRRHSWSLEVPDSPL